MKKILFLLLLPILAFAEPFIVQDTTNTLTPAETNTLIEKLKEIRNVNNIVISVQVIPTTGEQSIFDYSQHLFDTLQLGNKDSDNGLLFVIAKNDRKMRIQVGYGLENTITDAFSKRVLTNITQKYFKNNNFYTGIDLTIDEIVVQVSKEPIYAPQQLVSVESSNNNIIILAIVLLVFVVIMVIYLIIRHLQNLRDTKYDEYLNEYYRHYNPKPFYPTPEEEIKWNTNYTSPTTGTRRSSSDYSSDTDSSWSSGDTGGSSSGAGSDSSW